MQKIVLDTNVLVSAGIKKNSIPYKLVMDYALRGHVQIMTCRSVLAEYRNVLGRSKFADYDFPPKWLERLIQISQQLPEPPRWPHPLPDPTDAPFLALAHASGAWLVTGNLKHFPEPSRGGVHVLSPDRYLARLLGED